MSKNFFGFLIINKPVGITSYDCIRYIKKIMGKTVKIGHAGTLDPFACGIMIIALGRPATKCISLISNSDKEYIAKGKLGELTDTLDVTGQISLTQDCSWVPVTGVEAALQSLGTHYIQTPPLYSALKHQGKPLYQIARTKSLSSEDLELLAQKKRRTITLYEKELTCFENPFFTVRVRVSKGTYIRSLIDDIAQRIIVPSELGIQGQLRATTYELNRTKVGVITLEQATSLHTLKTIEDIENKLVKIEDLVAGAGFEPATFGL